MSTDNALSSRDPPSLRRSTSSSQALTNQQSILGFFQKASGLPTRPAKGVQNPPKQTKQGNGRSTHTHETQKKKGSNQSLTPAPSSDAMDITETPSNETCDGQGHGLPSPVTPMVESQQKPGKGVSSGATPVTFSSPSRKATIPKMRCSFVSSPLTGRYLGQTSNQLCRIGRRRR